MLWPDLYLRYTHNCVAMLRPFSLSIAHYYEVKDVVVVVTVLVEVGGVTVEMNTVVCAPTLAVDVVVVVGVVVTRLVVVANAVLVTVVVVVRVAVEVVVPVPVEVTTSVTVTVLGA